MAKRPRLLITNPTHPDGVALIETRAELIVAPDAEFDTLRRLAADVQGIIVRAKLPDDILDHAPAVRGIVRHGVGLDFIPVEAATRRGVPVANLPGSNAQAVAEYCIAARLRCAGRWPPPMPTCERAAGCRRARHRQSLSGDRRQHARHRRCRCHRRAPGADRAPRLRHDGARQHRRPEALPEHVGAVDVDTLFERADAIALCCPLTDQTRGLASAARIARMKPDAVLINVARGPVVDTQALLAALHAGRIAGAALDVHDQHPLPAEHPSFSTARAAADAAHGRHHLDQHAQHEPGRRGRDAQDPRRQGTDPPRQPRLQAAPPMKIRTLKAVPVSFAIPEGGGVRLGIGRAVKRDAVLVKVETDEGVTGWGEAHHGRCPGAIAKLVDTTLNELVLGMDALDVVGVWQRVYRMQLASHGMGYAATMALSGLDLALWDIRGKVMGQPLYRMLGGASRPVRAYAGGISLGYQEPAALAAGGAPLCGDRLSRRQAARGRHAGPRHRPRGGRAR
ncbi:MAG: NAD(P)-dependent oxidoreductase [Burkholderiaceae bacterium]